MWAWGLYWIAAVPQLAPCLLFPIQKDNLQRLSCSARCWLGALPFCNLLRWDEWRSDFSSDYSTIASITSDECLQTTRLLQSNVLALRGHLLSHVLMTMLSWWLTCSCWDKFVDCSRATTDIWVCRITYISRSKLLMKALWFSMPPKSSAKRKAKSTAVVEKDDKPSKVSVKSPQKSRQAKEVVDSDAEADIPNIDEPTERFVLGFCLLPSCWCFFASVTKNSSSLTMIQMTSAFFYFF